MVEGYSVRQLASQSKHSPKKLYRVINYYLEQVPPPAGLGLAQCQRLILDGTFLHRPRSLIAVMDANSHQVVASQYPISECSIPQLEAFLYHFMTKGLCPRSFTVDGNPTVMSVLHKLWPDVVIQRCIVHIQRQGLSWCRAYPKTSYARKLRTIFREVTSITTQVERDKFIEHVMDWERRYGYVMDRRPERGRVFSDIKRARSMLLRALPDMFHYIDDPQIPFSTNGLESYFSRLKGHYRQHRGLSKGQLSNYFNWYIHYVPK
jgi:hypothetical protein